MCRGWDWSLWAEDVDVSAGDASVLTEDVDCRSHSSSPVRRRAQLRPSRTRGALNRSCSVPDSNNPPCLSAAPPGDISVPVSDLTEIGAEDPSAWSSRGQKLDRGKSCESCSYRSSEDCEAASPGREDEDDRGGDATLQESTRGPSEDQSPAPTSSCASCQEPELEQKLSEGRIAPDHNHVTKSMLCLTEESQDEVRQNACDSKSRSVEAAILIQSCGWFGPHTPVVLHRRPLSGRARDEQLDRLRLSASCEG